MHDTPPDFATGTAQEWFIYFRQTKFIGAIPVKFKNTIKETTTPASARLIMTAYAACVLDITLFLYQEMGRRTLKAMGEEFDFTPASFLHLNLRDIASLAGQEPETLLADFRRLGFGVEDDGRITAYTAVKAPAASPRQP